MPVRVKRSSTFATKPIEIEITNDTHFSLVMSDHRAAAPRREYLTRTQAIQLIKSLSEVLLKRPTRGRA